MYPERSHCQSLPKSPKKRVISLASGHSRDSPSQSPKKEQEECKLLGRANEHNVWIGGNECVALIDTDP